MRSFGFEYIIVDSLGPLPPPGTENLGAADFGDSYGYGYVSNLEMSAQTGPADMPDDPNDQYLSDLSTVERDTYYIALYGRATKLDPETFDERTTDPGTQNKDGCLKEAEQIVDAGRPASHDEAYLRSLELRDELVLGRTVQKAVKDWASCMAGINAEYEFSSEADRFSYLDLQRANLEGYDLRPWSGDEVEQQSESWFRSVVFSDGHAFERVGEPHPLSADEYDRLATLELALYSADLSCRSSTRLAITMLELDQQIAQALLEEFPDLVSKGGR
jgi:hypothetical protein